MQAFDDTAFDNTVRAIAKTVVERFKAERKQKHDSSIAMQGVKLVDLPQDKERFALYRTARFSKDKRLLYRPAIVREMEEHILDSENEYYGTMIKGPQGIGKSHSLVNLVSHLRSQSHIVTFIPDCEKWRTTEEYVEAVCRSIGVEPAKFEISMRAWDEAKAKFLVKCVIAAMTKANKDVEKDKQLHWFMVFDQLNGIFARPLFQTARHIGALEEPFVFMKDFCAEDNVHSVIGASANNSLYYKENHEGFTAYVHPLRMSMDEVAVWQDDSAKFKSMSPEQREEMEDATGLCPLQVINYLKKKDAETYLKGAVDDVCGDIQQLLREKRGENLQEDVQAIAKNAIRCLLSLPCELFGSEEYDKKYSIHSDGCFSPLFPAVKIAYRIQFWDELMDYVEKEESELLEACRCTKVTTDVRGRLFELIVISRLMKKQILSNTDADAARAVLPERVDSGMTFDTQKLPSPSNMENNTLFIPKNSNFPAIDLILKEGKTVWGIQVHVSDDHHNVLPKFREMCEEKEWFDHFDDVKLVYLSPSPDVTQELKRKLIPEPGTRTKRQRQAKQEEPTIEVSADSIKDNGWACLENIQWP